jgi:hypothetical protein
MRIERHASPDVGGRASSRAANRPTIVELAKRSIEVPARLRKQWIAGTRFLPALP